MRIVKRFFDFFCALVGLILLSPVFIVISIAIKAKMSDGPIFFIQKRVGQHGVLFSMIKFRTMINAHSGSSISIKGEPRITPLGAILRNSKLDELPELINVLLGQMSLVGPRPDVPGYADLLDGDNRRILLLKPGITGVASLKYIDEEDILASCSNPKEYNDTVIFPDKVRINLLYLDQWSLWLDLTLIIDTFIRRPFKEEKYFKS